MVATVLYLSSLRNNERTTQKDIATASGVTEVTISQKQV
jgi:transcription initiation factor TFIIIB Brf1 subunit/transcription initiation factor TFIIB